MERIILKHCCPTLNGLVTSFVADLTMFINELNLKLQSRIALIYIHYNVVISMTTLLESQVMSNFILQMMSNIKTRSSKISILTPICKSSYFARSNYSFSSIFQNFNMGSTEEISISQNPLNCVIEGISLNLPLEVINLQCCDMLQSK